MLQILDDGRLTDGQGWSVNFKNTIIIMTSNIGSGLILNSEDKKEIEEKINDSMKLFFRPEFLNRLDEIIIFNRLNKEHIQKIVDIQLQKLQGRLNEKHISLNLTAKAKDLLGKRGYDSAYGARPLKRLVQKSIQDPIALKLLKGKIKERDQIQVDAEKESFVFHEN